ncbi:DNA repair protein RecN, partial [Flavobacteriaceae bacterium]|nr:DNA repair protein RecN [Flavobacteriaceae bacterium]
MGNALVDIHTQRQTIQLTDPAFYLKLIDAYGNNAKSLAAYKAAFKHWHISNTELENLRARQRQSDEALDYHKFLLNELEQLSLSPDMIATLEAEIHV